MLQWTGSRAILPLSVSEAGAPRPPPQQQLPQSPSMAQHGPALHHHGNPPRPLRLTEAIEPPSGLAMCQLASQPSSVPESLISMTGPLLSSSSFFSSSFYLFSNLLIPLLPIPPLLSCLLSLVRVAEGRLHCNHGGCRSAPGAHAARGWYVLLPSPSLSVLRTTC